MIESRKMFWRESDKGLIRKMYATILITGRSIGVECLGMIPPSVACACAGV